MKYANLHLHSTYSDAQFTPEQLVLIGKSLGYYALALTDHETDGGVKKFMAYAKKEGIRSVSGVEFYGKDFGDNFHLTALDFDMDDPGIRAFIQNRCDLHMESTRKIFEEGIRIGYIQNITWDQIMELTPPGAWMCIDSVMNVMRLRRAVPDDYDFDEFRRVVFKSDFAKSCKVAPPTAEEVIKVVRNAGGVVALAHPSEAWLEHVPTLVDWGLNGIEIDHAERGPRLAGLALEAAETYNLYHCGGTDHTGPMGGNEGRDAIPVFNGVTEEEYFALVERRLG